MKPAAIRKAVGMSHRNKSIRRHEILYQQLLYYCIDKPFAPSPFVPKALNHVKASVELVEGRMTVEWTKKDGRFSLLLDLPNGVSATVVMPDGKVRTAHARHQEWACSLCALRLDESE